jgi:hypothetical protein
MQELDWNWARLKEEQRNPERELPPETYPNAEKFRADRWKNNPKNYKISWREGVLRKEAWIDYKEHKGLWRASENRIWEEIVYAYRNEPGVTVTRQTARTDHYENLMNIKMIEVQQYGRPIESILIVDGTRLFHAKPTVSKDRYSYNYK